MRALTLCFTLIFLSGSCCLAELPPAVQSLAGIEEISVFVKSMGEDERAGGLNQKSIKSHVELKLRGYGIKVVPESTTGYLYVNITVVSSEYRSGYSVAVRYNQKVLLCRDQTIFCLGTTWTQGSTGTVANSNIRTHIIEPLDTNIEIFANDYLTANPK